jgi:hypothetical protein
VLQYTRLERLAKENERRVRDKHLNFMVSFVSLKENEAL